LLAQAQVDLIQKQGSDIRATAQSGEHQSLGSYAALLEH
jgi:hypothetical protein